MKIINDLLRLGYNKSAVDEVVGKITFSVDKDLAKKEYDKLYRKYSQKYSGSELEYRIKQKLYQKGLYMKIKRFVKKNKWTLLFILLILSFSLLIASFCFLNQIIIGILQLENICLIIKLYY